MNITGGTLNSRKIKVIELDNIKPTLSKVRQGIFNSLSTMMDFFEGKKFLDMFSGSGIMAFEAFSRGFIIYSFENDKLTYNEIKMNAKSLGINGKFFLGNAVKLLGKVDERFDVIYIDPPYNSELYEKSLSVIKDNLYLNKDGLVILERKQERNIDYNGFNLIKTKEYADKCIDFLNLD